MRRYIAVILLFFPVYVSAVEGNSVYQYSFIENSSTFLFGDNVNVRKGPEVADKNVTDTLSAGFPVKIVKKTVKVMALNGFSEYWYKVSYLKNGRERTGYIWGGLLAAGYLKIGSDLFMLGFKTYSAEGGFEGECRLLRGGELLSSIPVKLHYLPTGEKNPLYGYSITLELHDGLGLSGLSNAVSIYCNYEACGYPRGNVWAGVADGALYYIGTDTSISEAGVFQYDEEMIFPYRDKTLKDEVRIITRSFDFDEKIKDYRLSDKKERRFRWINFRLEERK